MSAQPDTVTTLETIAHLDFTPDIPCEVCALRGQSPLPGAWWLRRPTCLTCGAGPRVYPACEDWVRHFPYGIYTHVDCGAVRPLSEVAVLGRIGGAL